MRYLAKWDGSKRTCGLRKDMLAIKEKERLRHLITVFYIEISDKLGVNPKNCDHEELL